MAAVLTWPVGRANDGEAVTSPRARPVLAYVAGSVLGAAMTTSLVFTMARLVELAGHRVLTAAVLAIAAFAISLEWCGHFRPLYQRAVQVPRRWLLWQHKSLTGAAFGAMIGSGVLTHMKHASAYALFAMFALAPTYETALAVGAVYGVARGGTLVGTWIGDRFVGRRPRWPNPTRRPAPINRALAVVAAGAVAAALLLTL